MHHHNMIEKLLVLQIPPNFIHWMHDFLSNIPQHVMAARNTAPNIITNTGATQRCVGDIFIIPFKSIYFNWA